MDIDSLTVDNFSEQAGCTHLQVRDAADRLSGCLVGDLQVFELYGTNIPRELTEDSLPLTIKQMQYVQNTVEHYYKMYENATGQNAPSIL